MFTLQIMLSLFSQFQRSAADPSETSSVSHLGQTSANGLCRPLLRRGAFALSILLLASSTAMAQVPGTLDTTFGSGTGKVILPIGLTIDQANATVVQPDGKIVLAGSCRDINGVQVFCAARLNADGTLDGSFVGPSGTGNGKFLLPVGARNGAYATAIALQSNGKIVLAGYCQDVVGNYDDFCAARLNSDGTLDTTFGAGTGKVALPIGVGYDQASGVALQSDNKIVLAGTCFDTTFSNADFCVARLNVDGTLDASFVGPSGTGGGKFELPIGTSDDKLNGVAVQASDGKIVMFGTCNNGSPTDFCVARLNTNGSLDTSFVGPSGTGNGKFLLPIGKTYDYGAAIAIQTDGKIVLAGYCQGDTGVDFCAARLNVNGAFDANFVGPSGTVDGKFLLPIGTNGDYATSIALQLDGKILVAGYCEAPNLESFCVVRLNGDGTRDTSFVGTAATGKVLLPIGAYRNYATAVALQSDGKLVMAGFCANNPANSSDVDFCVGRLHGGPNGIAGCSLDIDGDGLTTATVDGLIATRVMLGLRGPTVIAGINFSVNAKRNSWPAISQYLVSQCGLNVY